MSNVTDSHDVQVRLDRPFFWWLYSNNNLGELFLASLRPYMALRFVLRGTEQFRHVLFSQ